MKKFLENGKWGNGKHICNAINDSAMYKKQIFDRIKTNWWWGTKKEKDREGEIEGLQKKVPCRNDMADYNVKSINNSIREEEQKKPSFPSGYVFFYGWESAVPMVANVINSKFISK